MHWFSVSLLFLIKKFKGTVMGPVLVLVCPRFRENVVVTCKIGSFFVKFRYFSSEKCTVIAFFFFLEITFQNGAHLKKKGNFRTTFHIFSQQ